MVFYIVYRMSREDGNRTHIVRKLRSLRCVQIHRSLWKISENQIDHVLNILKGKQTILLRRTRTIKKAKYSKNELEELGSLVIIAYKIPDEASRKKVINFLKMAPCIRLCRSVYAFYQMHTQFDKEHELIDVNAFYRFLQRFHGDAKIIPRIAVEDPESREILLDIVKNRVENETSIIIKYCIKLHEIFKSGKKDSQWIQATYKKLRIRAIKVRKISKFYDKWLMMNFSTSLARMYSCVHKLKKDLKIP